MVTEMMVTLGVDVSPHSRYRMPSWLRIQDRPWRKDSEETLAHISPAFCVRDVVARAMTFGTISQARDPIHFGN